MFWKNKRVFITGITGFKGSWLAYWLKKKGAKINGLGLKIETYPNIYKELLKETNIDFNISDISDYAKTFKLINNFKPHIIIHMAAQPLVITGYQEPYKTFNTNLIGTLNILNIIKELKICKMGIIITSDKVYKNNNLSSEVFYEKSELGGEDPYSASKSASEIITNSYLKSYFNVDNKKLVSLRAGNVIGGGDWSENRLIPDIIKCWRKNETLNVRNPYSIRPWQHILDTLNGYISISEHLWYNDKLSGSYNIGPSTNKNLTVKAVIKILQLKLDYKKVVFEKKSNLKFNEKKTLNLDTKKIYKSIGYKNKLTINESLNLTCDWYKAYYKGSTAKELIYKDIEYYESL